MENIIRFHYEKWNGKRYLNGKDIPLEARIVSIINYYNMLTINRGHKTKMSHEEAIEILRKESGRRFDPDIVSMFEIFENRFKRLLKK